mmetsp:Transcript_4150/g.10753  ORF Transcript_4150/g.10753 Transcript_4150/m.10753 type:complete len:90 (+) Transcript_4150:240-509(+)
MLPVALEGREELLAGVAEALVSAMGATFAANPAAHSYHGLYTPGASGFDELLAELLAHALGIRRASTRPQSRSARCGCSSSKRPPRPLP